MKFNLELKKLGISAILFLKEKPSETGLAPKKMQPSAFYEEAFGIFASFRSAPEEGENNNNNSEWEK